MFGMFCRTAVILPVHIPFSAYGKHMVGRDSIKVSAVAIDKNLDDIYETEINIALEPLLISIEVSRVLR